MLIFRRIIVLVQHLVSSLSLDDCSVHRLRDSSRNLCTEQSPKDGDDTKCCTDTVHSRNLCTEQSSKDSDDTKCCTDTVHSRNLCTEQSPKDSDDTKFCTNTIHSRNNG